MMNIAFMIPGEPIYPEFRFINTCEIYREKMIGG